MTERKMSEVGKDSMPTNNLTQTVGVSNRDEALPGVAFLYLRLMIRAPIGAPSSPPLSYSGFSRMSHAHCGRVIVGTRA